MQKIKNTLLLFLAFITTNAQDITGQWNGILKEVGLRVVFHITKTDDGFSSTLDSPDQGATGIPVTETLFANDSLKIRVVNLGITYTAKLSDTNFKGTFVQGGMQIPLELKREALEKPKLNRPQEPKPPFPYYNEEVTFKNENAGITLAGTLTLPQKEGRYPAVILITGSGPQDRNEELAGHKPFLIIADHLTRKGIAVLRYDDRGFGQSTGDFSSAVSPDFASDVECAVKYLKTRKEIDKANIGLVGHSEGGVIAPMVASKSQDVAFIVLLAGTGIPGDQLLSLQGALIEKAVGKNEEEIEKSAVIRKKMIDMVLQSNDIPTLRADLTSYLKNQFAQDKFRSLIPNGIDLEQFIASQVNFMATPWMAYFLGHDPAKVLEQVKCPVLALNGAKDLQVPPKENLEAIQLALKKARNNNVTVKELPRLNHLFQESTTGSPMEYGSIEQTFSPSALREVSNWILQHTK